MVAELAVGNITTAHGGRIGSNYDELLLIQVRSSGAIVQPVEAPQLTVSMSEHQLCPSWAMWQSFKPGASPTNQRPSSYSNFTATNKLEESCLLGSSTTNCLC